jgi:2-dehydropantoate 2-reductase
MGSGGVGGYFGGRLAAAGFDVAFIARGAHLEAMRGNGLRIGSPLGDALIQTVRATDTPAEVGPVDYLLFATKLWDTGTAAEACRPLVGPETAVFSLQNGVDAADRLGAILGPEHIMGGVSQIAAVIRRPGVIGHNSDFARIIVGEFGGISSPRGKRLLAALEKAGITTQLSDDISAAIWQKFVFLVGFSALTSVTRLPIGPVRADPETRGLLGRIMAEAAAVAQARGVALDDGIVDTGFAFVDSAPATMTSSMAEDLARGNRLELDWLSGAVVRLGRELGVETPANAFIASALKLHAGGSR